MKSKIDKKIRVLTLINDLRYGGAEMMTYEILNRLDSSLFVSFVCCPGASEDLRADFEKAGHKVIYLNTGLIHFWKNISKLLKTLKEENIDVISAHLIPSVFYGSSCAQLMGKPVIATIHNQVTGRSIKGVLKERFFVSLCDQVIAVSESVRQDVMKHYGISSQKVKLIWNGSPVDKFDPIRYQRQDLRTQFFSSLGLPERSVIVGTVATLKAEKNHHCLITCLPELKKHIPNLKFLFVGDGPLKGALERQAQELGVSKDVIFLGSQKDVGAYLSIMDVFVLPSISEGCPISLMEAMLMEKPIVATNIGSLSEMLNHGQAGVVVKPDNCDQLTEGILKLLQDERKMLTLGQAARVRAKELFDIDKTARLFQETLLEVHQRKSGG